MMLRNAHWYTCTKASENLVASCLGVTQGLLNASICGAIPQMPVIFGGTNCLEAQLPISARRS